jgi:hypothetical protein
MATSSTALWLLAQEAQALLTRLARVRPLALHEPMVPAAGISPIAQTAIERYLAEGRRELRERVHPFLNWLQGPEGHRATPAEAQRRFTFLFRINLDDPHPFPWLRVKLSCALGQALYPHPQWGKARQAVGVFIKRYCSKVKMATLSIVITF